MGATKVSTKKTSPQKQVCEGKGAEQKAQILEIAMEHGIEPDEPFWLVFQATGQLESLLLKIPGDLRAIARAIGTMGKKHELAQADQQTLQQAQAKTAKEQKEIATLTASIVSNASNENKAQWRRTVIATAGWFFGGVVATQLFYSLVPQSPLNRALQVAEQSEEAMEIVESFGSPLSAWSWVLNKSECVKQTRANGTSKCSIEI